jgi:hypothetical protein
VPSCYGRLYLPTGYGHANTDKIIVAHGILIGYKLRHMSLSGVFLIVLLGLISAFVMFLAIFSRRLVFGQWNAIDFRQSPGLLPLETSLNKHGTALRLKKVVKLWCIPTFHPNGCAVRDSMGRIHCFITTGALRALDDKELDAFLMVLICLGQRRSRWLLPFLSLLLFVEKRAERSPWLVQQCCEAIIRITHRAILSRGVFSEAEWEAKGHFPGFILVAALQKISVLGKKIPWDRATLSLDPLFCMPSSGSGLDFLWTTDLRPNLETRRMALLAGPSCESRGPLS